MSGPPIIDCQGLVGAWTLGAVQAGFELAHRTSLGSFGDRVIAENRPLVGDGWEQDPGNGCDEWQPKEAAAVIGTPPCSGFSLLNRSKKENARGPDSAINSCMRELVRYAARCRGTDGEPGPEIVSFESVQGAGKQGRGLMLALRDSLERDTGQEYGLSHVFCSGSTVGAAQMRHRYYFVAHRIPFGIDAPTPRRVCTYGDAIGDLVGLEQTWEVQSVVHDRVRDWWLEEQQIVEDPGLRSWTRSVTDHVSMSKGRAIEVILDELVDIWEPGTSLSTAARAYRERYGKLPTGFERTWMHDEDALRGFNHPGRIRSDRPGYVITGGGASQFVHWSEPRFLSVRELARLMGFPDTWQFGFLERPDIAGMYIGKTCPVISGRWIAEWFLRALDGDPGAPLEEVGDREYRHDSTSLYKPWLKEQALERAPA